MVNEYFGFTKNPFSRNVSTKDIFLWNGYENLKARFDYFIKEGGIFLLTGAIGSGKTIALKNFAGSVDPNKFSVIYFNGGIETRKDFYRNLLIKCGITPSFFTGDCRNLIIKHFLEMRMVKKQTIILIFDEAQNLPGFLLEDIRLLGNFDYDSIAPAYFLFSGHRLLQQRFTLKENEALKQRLTLQYHLQGLALEDTLAYITHCLNQAGSTNRIFTDSVLPRIHDESAGIPRMINKICNSLLLAAVMSEKKTVDDLLFDSSRDEWS